MFERDLAVSILELLFHAYLYAFRVRESRKKASVVGTVLKQTGIMCTTSEKVNFINIFDLTNTQLIFTNILQYL